MKGAVSILSRQLKPEKRHGVSSPQSLCEKPVLPVPPRHLSSLPGRTEVWCLKVSGSGGDLSPLPWKTDILIWLLFVTITKPFSSLGHHMTWHLPYSLSQTSLSVGFMPRVEFLPGYSNQGAMISQENVYFSVYTFSRQFLAWLWLQFSA